MHPSADQGRKIGMPPALCADDGFAGQQAWHTILGVASMRDHASAVNIEAAKLWRPPVMTAGISGISELVSGSPQCPKHCRMPSMLGVCRQQGMFSGTQAAWLSEGLHCSIAYSVPHMCPLHCSPLTLGAAEHFGTHPCKLFGSMTCFHDERRDHLQMLLVCLLG